jgi:hypothetical protein
MQAARSVLLDDELISFATRRAPARLRGNVELTLLAIYLKTHDQRPLARPLDLLVLRWDALERG